MIRPSKRTGMFSTGTCSPRIGWWMLPRTISPVCRQRATSVHCDSLTVWPTRSWSTSVGRLLGRIWPEHDQLGVLARVARLARADGVHRHQEQEVGEGEVGQHAPAPEQALQVLELLGLEVGVALRQLGRGRHLRLRPLGHRAVRPRRRARHRHRVRRPGPVPLQLADPDGRQQRAQVVGPVGDVVEMVRVRRRGERHAGAPRSGRAAPGPGTAPPPACANRTRTAPPPCPTTPPPRRCGPTTRRARPARTRPP